MARRSPWEQVNLGWAIFPPPGMRLNLPAKLVGKQLHAIADTQHRQPTSENILVNMTRVLIVDTIRPAGEYHSFSRQVAGGQPGLYSLAAARNRLGTRVHAGQSGGYIANRSRE